MNLFHVRVYPDVTLKTLRGQLGSLLGAERNMDKFSFLKCVGRSLALVGAATHSPRLFFFSLYSLYSVSRRQQRHNGLINRSTIQGAEGESVSEKRKTRLLFLPSLFYIAGQKQTGERPESENICSSICRWIILIF